MSKKTLRGLIAFILVAIIIVGLVIASGIGSSVDGKWFQNGDVQTWFDSWGQGTKDDKDFAAFFPGDGILAEGDGNTESEIKLTMTKIAPVATAENGSHTTYKVTAKVTPENTTDKLDMALSGAEASKVTLVHEDGAFEATVTVNTPFSSTITLTATIRERGISKSIKLDYLGKVKGAKNNHQLGGILDNEDDDFDELNYYNFSVGSVTPTRLQGSLVMSWSDEIYNAMVLKGWSDLNQSNKGWTVRVTSEGAGNSVSYFELGSFFSSGLEGSRLTQFKSDLYNVLYSKYGAPHDGGNYKIGTVTYTLTNYYTLGGTEYDCGVSTFSVDCIVDNYGDVGVHASDVELGGDILFYE